MKTAIKVISFIWALAFFAFIAARFYGSLVGPLPPTIAAYFFTFQKALESFLSSWLFGVVFVFVWVAISFQLSIMGGWAKLAKHYRFTGRLPDSIKKLHMGSGRIGNISYNNTLRVAVSRSGIVLKVFFMFRIGHPCLQIPWQCIEAICIQGSPIDKSRNPILHAISSKLSWSKYAKISLNQLPDQNLIIPWKIEFSSNIPNSITVHDGH
jgi:hypothetical protein